MFTIKRTDGAKPVSDFLRPGDRLVRHWGFADHGNDERRENFLSLSATLHRFDIAITEETPLQWPRDLHILLTNGRYWLNRPPFREQLKGKDRLCFAASQHRVPPEYRPTGRDAIDVLSLGSASSEGSWREARQITAIQQQLEAPIFVEGGNLLVGPPSGPDGAAAYVITGYNTLIATAALFRNYPDLAGRCGPQAAAPATSRCKLIQALAAAERALMPGDIFSLSELVRAKKALQLALVDEPKKLILVPQADFHIDMCLAVGPGDTVFVDDPSLTQQAAHLYHSELTDILNRLTLAFGPNAKRQKHDPQSLKKTAKELLPHLREEDWFTANDSNRNLFTKLAQCIQEEMQQTADIMLCAQDRCCTHGGVLAKVRAKLRAKELEPIGVPAIAEIQMLGRHVTLANLMNGLAIMDERQTPTVYVHVTGATRLPWLEQAFAAVLAGKGMSASAPARAPVQAIFVGAPSCLERSLRARGGLRCRTSRMRPSSGEKRSGPPSLKPPEEPNAR